MPRLKSLGQSVAWYCGGPPTTRFIFPPSSKLGPAGNGTRVALSAGKGGPHEDEQNHGRNQETHQAWSLARLRWWWLSLQLKHRPEPPKNGSGLYTIFMKTLEQTLQYENPQLALRIQRVLRCSRKEALELYEDLLRWLWLCGRQRGLAERTPSFGSGFPTRGCWTTSRPSTSPGTSSS